MGRHIGGVLLLKPTVTWPIFVFLAIALWPERRAVARYLGGLAASAVIFIGLGFWDIPRWILAVLHFSKQIGSQQAMAGLDGLLHLAPAQWGLGTGLASPATWGILAIGLVGMGWLARRVANPAVWASPSARVAWAAALPVVIWILVTPYAHTYDDIFLVPLLMLLVGTDGHKARRLVVAAAVLAVAILPALGQIGIAMSGPSLAPLAALLLVILGVQSMGSARGPRTPPDGSDGGKLRSATAALADPGDHAILSS